MAHPFAAQRQSWPLTWEQERDDERYVRARERNISVCRARMVLCLGLFPGMRMCTRSSTNLATPTPVMIVLFLCLSLPSSITVRQGGRIQCHPSCHTILPQTDCYGATHTPLQLGEPSKQSLLSQGDNTFSPRGSLRRSFFTIHRVHWVCAVIEGHGETRQYSVIQGNQAEKMRYDFSTSNAGKRQAASGKAAKRPNRCRLDVRPPPAARRPTG